MNKFYSKVSSFYIYFVPQTNVFKNVTTQHILLAGWLIPTKK